jgi:hypothetical protein
LKKQKTSKKAQDAGESSLLELLDQVEAEMERLRAENLRLTQATMKVEEPKIKRVSKPPALGKGLAQLFGGPKRD